MDLTLGFGLNESATELVVYSAHNKTVEAKNKSTSKKTEAKPEKVLSHGHWPKELQEKFNKLKIAKDFKGEAGETLSLTMENGSVALIWGLGDKSKMTREGLRKTTANLYKAISGKYAEATIFVDGFLGKDKEESLKAMTEALLLTEYVFDRHLSVKKTPKLQKLTLATEEKKTAAKKWEAVINETQVVCKAINFARDLINESPNYLNSETYPKEVEKDAKKLKHTKIKILGRKEIQKEKMGMFLAVNAASHYDPHLVHLTYSHPKAGKNAKHIALVGKGLTFDTGGYSLKPGPSMMNMKFDMAGSAVVYAVFKAVAELELPIKLSCFLGITDNTISNHGTVPDSIVTARNGKTVKILNTDAEGRLVLGDVVDYACDYKPDVIIDVATLTGAILVALGSEVCGLFSNDDKLAHELLKSAKNSDEYMWHMPIIDEHKNDLKAIMADYKNIGSSPNGGSAKGAAFIQYFVRDGISWAHLDIAGIGDSQAHLPYCPTKGASGLVIRTLLDYVRKA